MATRLNKTLLGGLSAGLLLAGSFSATAANVSAFATIDWSKFSIVAIPDDLLRPITFDQSGRRASVDTCGSSGCDSNAAADWSTSITAAAHVANITALSSDTAAGSNLATNSVRVSGGPSAHHYSESIRTESILITGGSGSLVIKVPATLALSFSDVVSGDGFISVFGDNALAVRKGVLVNTSDQSFQIGTGDPRLSAFPNDAILAVIMAVKAGDSLSLFADSHVDATLKTSAVPVPAALWLLGSAVAGLSFARRRCA